MLVVGIQFSTEEGWSKAEALNITGTYPQKKEGKRCDKKSDGHDKPEPECGFLLLLFKQSISKRQVLCGSDKTEPTTANPPKQRRDQEEKEPY
jgi:hypothetical protein